MRRGGDLDGGFREEEPAFRLSGSSSASPAAYQSVEKIIPGFFNRRLAKGVLANLANFLALSGRKNSAPHPVVPTAR
jgi:hypothetical protein